MGKIIIIFVFTLVFFSCMPQSRYVGDRPTKLVAYVTETGTYNDNIDEGIKITFLFYISSDEVLSVCVLVPDDYREILQNVMVDFKVSNTYVKPGSVLQDGAFLIYSVNNEVQFKVVTGQPCPVDSDYEYVTDLDFSDLTNFKYISVYGITDDRSWGCTQTPFYVEDTLYNN